MLQFILYNWDVIPFNNLSLKTHVTFKYHALTFHS